MNCVDWHDADAFCRWAGGRLMTKSEWHDEASESGRRTYPWGSDEPTCEFAVMNDWMTHGGNFRQGCGERGTWPVCSKPKGRSVHGLCDLSGNVWEWTDTKEFPGPETEPRYNLGGSYANTPPYLEAEYTLVNPTKFRIDVLGMRCRIAL
jgi:formylglycine-generating enzyme required for sulfatase activity